MTDVMKRLSAVILSAVLLITMSLPMAAEAATEEELRSSIISVAQGEVGYTGTSSYSKYGEWYGYQGGWCTTFVLWCCNQVGEANNVKINGKVVPSGGNCNSMISWFKNKGRYYEASSGYTPIPGDLVFFDWSGNGSCQHVGFVTSTSKSTVYTVEGNCSGKVKAREYTKNGSKPYNNISAIMGYASPDFSSVANGQATSAKKTTTKKQTTIKKETTTKKKTTKKETTTEKTTKETSSKKPKTTKKETTTKKKTTKETTTKPTTTETTTTATTQPEPEMLESLEIYASTYELQIGDSVKLEYSAEPSNVPAVVGYFCDEEGIIEIGEEGEIHAIGEGTATVVVCANNDLYKQCDFVVTQAVAQVTSVAKPTEHKVVETTVVTTQKNARSVLTRMGVNVDALARHRQLYIVPISIAGSTAFVCVLIVIMKKIKRK